MKLLSALAMWVVSLVLLGLLAKICWLIASLGWHLI